MAQTLNLQPGDRVCFNAETIRRTQHNPDTVAFAGNILALYAGGKVADVETVDGVRGVPVANLAKVDSRGRIYDLTY